MKRYDMNQLNEAELDGLCRREASQLDDILPGVQEDIEKVKLGGDAAVRALTKKYDHVDIPTAAVTAEEVEQACAAIDPEVKEAFAQAADNIESFHRLHLMGRRTVATMPGVTCFSEMRPVEKVGLYIPGGTAPLASTALMLAIPAQLAGCSEIALTTPPTKEKKASDIILFAAHLCGINTIYKTGGPQGIAALAYGTESVPKVDKIFGPGSSYVTAAKQLVSRDPEGAAIDMPAGPTEVLVIADKEAYPDFVASDLLAQAEHAEDARAILVCTSSEKAEAISQEVEKQLVTLPRQKEARAALQNSFVMIVSSVSEAISFSNRYAPEHLILNVRNAETLASEVTNAGSVFLGQYSCESAGDYASGTNHCLPTYGYAKVFGGVSVASFQKQITFQRLTADGAAAIAPTVELMAAQESLEGHRRAMELRASTAKEK